METRIPIGTLKVIVPLAFFRTPLLILEYVEILDRSAVTIGRFAGT